MRISMAEAQRMYIDYHCYGNTLHTSDEEMGYIVHEYSDQISRWRKSVTDDVNEYQFDDSEFENWKSEGKKDAKDKTGYEGTSGQKAGQVTRGVVDGVAGGAGGLITMASYGGLAKGVARNITDSAIKKGAEHAAKKAAKKALKEAIKDGSAKLNGEIIKNASETAAKKAVGKTVDQSASTVLEKAVSSSVEDVAKEAAEKTTEKAGEKMTENGAKKIGGAFVIAAPLALAQGLAYAADKPNEEQKKACDELNTIMQTSQGELAEKQAEMSTMAEQIAAGSDEAQMVNEEANDNMENVKTEYDVFAATRSALLDKANSEGLTNEERSLFENLTSAMVESGEEIAVTQEDTQTTVNDIYSDLGTYQEGYDLAAESMGTIEGITDYAESIDETTRTMCIVESASQGLNAASGGKAAFQASRFAASGGIYTAWAWAFAAAGAAGAVLSGVGSIEQAKYSEEVGNEINARTSTQGLNNNTKEIYSQEIANYETTMGNIESLELTVPEDVEAPEDTLPVETTQSKKKDNNYRFIKNKKN